MRNTEIDHGKVFDWGRASADYAKYRDIYPQEFYQKILDLGLCQAGQKVLDLGTGTGVLPRNLYQYGADFTGIDISENQIGQVKKLAEEGYKKYRINSGDTKEDLSVLDGIICLGTFSQSMMERIESYQKPTVFADAVPDTEKFDSVIHDIERSVLKVMKYLMDQGHEKIAFIGGYETDSDGAEVVDNRTYAYQRFMKQEGYLYIVFRNFVFLKRLS